MLTKGEFFFALAKIAEAWYEKKFDYSRVAGHAKNNNVDIDLTGPGAEIESIVSPIAMAVQSLTSKSTGNNIGFKVANMELAYEAYRTYLIQRDIRIRTTAAVEQSQRRHADA
jgi:hypothetical protein